MFKKVLSIFITIILTVCCASPAFATAEKITPRLYTFYTDNMLFKQNTKATLAGTGVSGEKIQVTLFNSLNKPVAEGTCTVSKDGTFEVSFDAPAGGYEEYTVTVTQNGKEFAKLSNVVFGELWFAGGQSNMMYPLAQAKGATEWYEQSKKLSRNIRVLVSPAFEDRDGQSELLPKEPATDITDSRWVTGEDTDIYGMSAVAFFFANELTEKLNMPVGILNVSLGGTTIASWLSRETIDSNEIIKKDLVNRDGYIELDDWLSAERSVFRDMTVNYNLRVEALKHFNISGIIWYQGESDIMLDTDKNAYFECLAQLQKSYSELFGAEGELLPLIYSQLAAFYYDESGFLLPERNILYTEFQQKSPKTRACVPIYDLPLTYPAGVGCIHPESKREIGERMAFSAMGLTYGSGSVYTAPGLKAAEIRKDGIYVTLTNTGSGITCNGSTLGGFSVCGKDGIYVPANAEIVNKNTVKVWSENVKNPVSAAYACSVLEPNANLFSTVNGKIAYPVSSFITDKSVGTRYWIEAPWMDCESYTVWQNTDMENSDIYYSWNHKDAAVLFSEEYGCNSTAGMAVINSKNNFSVGPKLSYKEKHSTKRFQSVVWDYSTYGKLSFCVRNDGTEDVTLDSLKLYKNALLWYTPAIDGTKDNKTVIPPDGQWHTVTLDFNRLNLFGNVGGKAYANGKLKEVRDFKFCFTTDAAEQTICLDNFRFTPSAESHTVLYDADKTVCDTLIEKISVFFTNLVG